MIPDRGAATLNVEVCVAVFDTDQTVFGDFWLSEQSIVGPVVFNPRQTLHNLRTLHNTIHPVQEKKRTTWIESMDTFETGKIGRHFKVRTLSRRTPDWLHLRLSFGWCCNNNRQTLSASSCYRSVSGHPQHQLRHQDLRCLKKKKKGKITTFIHPSIYLKVN